MPEVCLTRDYGVSDVRTRRGPTNALSRLTRALLRTGLRPVSLYLPTCTGRITPVAVLCRPAVSGASLTWTFSIVNTVNRVRTETAGIDKNTAVYAYAETQSPRHLEKTSRRIVERLVAI
jgi:hypothetical protein